MINKYDEFFNHYRVRIDALARQDYILDKEGKPNYINTKVFGDTEYVILSDIENHDIVSIADMDEYNITKLWVDKFEQFDFNETLFKNYLKETVKVSNHCYF